MIAYVFGGIVTYYNGGSNSNVKPANAAMRRARGGRAHMPPSLRVKTACYDSFVPVSR